MIKNVNSNDYLAENYSYLDEKLSELSAECVAKLRDQGFAEAQILTEPYLHLRYTGTDCALMCGPAQSCSSPAPAHGDFLTTFIDRFGSYLVFLSSQHEKISRIPIIQRSSSRFFFDCDI